MYPIHQLYSIRFGQNWPKMPQIYRLKEMLFFYQNWSKIGRIYRLKSFLFSARSVTAHKMAAKETKVDQKWVRFIGDSPCFLVKVHTPHGL